MRPCPGGGWEGRPCLDTTLGQDAVLGAFLPWWSLETLCDRHTQRPNGQTEARSEKGPMVPISRAGIGPGSAQNPSFTPDLRGLIPHNTEHEGEAQRPGSPARGPCKGELSRPGHRSCVSATSLGEELRPPSLPPCQPLLDPLAGHIFEAVREDLVVTPMLQVRKLRPREVKLLIHGHAASQLPCTQASSASWPWLKTRSLDGNLSS